MSQSKNIVVPSVVTKVDRHSAGESLPFLNLISLGYSTRLGKTVEVTAKAYRVVEFVVTEKDVSLSAGGTYPSYRLQGSGCDHKTRLANDSLWYVLAAKCIMQQKRITIT